MRRDGAAPKGGMKPASRSMMRIRRRSTAGQARSGAACRWHCKAKVGVATPSSSASGEMGGGGLVAGDRKADSVQAFGQHVLRKSRINRSRSVMCVGQAFDGISLP